MLQHLVVVDVDPLQQGCSAVASLGPPEGAAIKSSFLVEIHDPALPSESGQSLHAVDHAPVGGPLQVCRMSWFAFLQKRE